MGSDHRGRRDASIRERAEPGHELVGGTRRVLLVDRVVEHRLIRVLRVLLEVLLADARGELVAVVGRHADHREDFAGLGIHDDHHAALQAGRLHRPGQRLQGELLFVGVDRQLE